MDHRQLKDDMPADLANSLKADEGRKSDHTTLVHVKEIDEVATLTATIETNFQQGDLKTSVCSLSGGEEWEKKRHKSRMEGLRRRLLMWRLSPESMRDDLENILREWLPAGALQRELACDPADPIGFAPWPLPSGRGEPRASLSQVHRKCNLCDEVDGMKRRRRRRLQRVPEASERCRCTHDTHPCFSCTTFLNSRFASGCCVSGVSFMWELADVGTG